MCCIYVGHMPAKATLFNDSVESIFEFGNAHRNTVSWSPHGRFLCLAGFGNLAGDLDFYDVLRLRKIGNNLYCVVVAGRLSRFL